MFLVGYFFITMGMLTVMFMAATYGEKEIAGETVLIATILVIQLIGMVGAWLFARLSGQDRQHPRVPVDHLYLDRRSALPPISSKTRSAISLVAIVVGMVMGGSQSLARSTFSKMLPPTEDHTSFFSFYDVMEKLATVAGTFIFGIIEALTGSMRYSILAIVLFFGIGLGFLLPLEEGRRDDVLSAILNFRGGHAKMAASRQRREAPGRSRKESGMDIEVAITTALQFENQVVKVYEDAARNTLDPTGRKMFETLVCDEQGHG